MAFKKPATHTPVPESPDRLFRDLPRRKHASLYDHQGQMLRSYVTDGLNARDVALQLPTGSGKTLVGLLLAEWRRRRNRERVVYLCPTRQLVNQVAEEASTKYGLSVEAFTGAIKTYRPDAKAAYTAGERVAVTTYNSLFNVNPFFVNPDLIIVDDAHAAESYIASQWTFQISRSDPDDATLFAAVAGVLKAVLTTANFTRLTGDWEGIDDATWVDKVPTDKFNQISDELRAVITANVGDAKQKYAWRMLADHLHACQLYVSSTEILIRPLIPPTWTHQPFDNAKQRIFMSATLGAGGDLERLTGRSNILRLPIPEGWDRQGIGRRFFIFPEKSLDEKATLVLRQSLMRLAKRSLVLAPSNDAASVVQQDVAKLLKYPTFTAADLEETKSAFVSSDRAVAIVANRYDGIDFPGDDCRLLFVEGLPRAANLQERFLMSRMGAQLLFNERVQTRVLQAIGRCTRGLNDYSAVVVTGEDLPDYLTDLKRRSYLHPELQAELEFGIDQSTNVSQETLGANFKIFLDHGAEWEKANDLILEAREQAIQSQFPAMGELANAVSDEISYQAAMWQSDYLAALEAAREVLAKLTDPGLKGYRALWYYLAGSAAELGAAGGDEDLKKHALAYFERAKALAQSIPWLVDLARRRGLSVTPQDEANATIMRQVERLEARIAKLGMLHNRDFSARERDIREGLKQAKSFEQAQRELGEHLGFFAGKMERDASPDPWWLIGEFCIVFEDHADAKPDGAVIDATKARQAASHPDWIQKNVIGAKDANVLSVLVTPAKLAKEGAIPSLSRVAYWDLRAFRDWAEEALIAIRKLRRSFVEVGDLDWRAQAAAALVEIGADGPGLYATLSKSKASDQLQCE
jgi:hypothetical protein